MKEQRLSRVETASLCRELALLLHAGVGPGDAVSLLAEETPEGRLREILSAISAQVDEGVPLAAAMEATGAFPAYVTGLLEMGQRSGRTEEALESLAGYYEARERTDQQLRSALTYPAILLLLMLAVIVVLLAKVLPVSEDVYASLGGRLTGVAGGLLGLGRALDRAMPVLCVLLGLAAAFVAVFSLSGMVREKVLTAWRKRRGDKGVSRKRNDARFAQALAMGLRSGLPLEESVDLAGSMVRDVPQAQARCRACREKLAAGADLTAALGETGMLPSSAVRLLALGLRGGSGDTVMEEIARRLSEEADLALERKVAKVEPALVLGTSLLVGAILLSVMLPLMDIMTAIG